MPDFPIPDDARHALASLNLHLPPDALAKLARYLDLLLQANQQFNLTSVTDPVLAWRRHIIDSLTLAPLLADLPPGSNIIDVGTGGGLPGIPIAIARPDLHVTLLEATKKKTVFLQQCVDQLPLPNASVLLGRAETIGQKPAHRNKYHAALCRALAPLPALLEYTLPLVQPAGKVLALKGAKAQSELDLASNALKTLGAGVPQLLRALPAEPDSQSVIILIPKARPTPKTYPRSPGTPHKFPL